TRSPRVETSPGRTGQGPSLHPDERPRARTLFHSPRDLNARTSSSTPAATIRTTSSDVAAETRGTDGGEGAVADGRRGIESPRCGAEGRRRLSGIQALGLGRRWAVVRARSPAAELRNSLVCLPRSLRLSRNDRPEGESSHLEKSRAPLLR